MAGEMGVQDTAGNIRFVGTNVAKSLYITDDEGMPQVELETAKNPLRASTCRCANRGLVPPAGYPREKPGSAPALGLGDGDRRHVDHVAD